MPCRNKFFACRRLAAEIAREKMLGKTIVLANGGFDLIHIGHIRYLQQAKAKGDILVVALNSDSSLKQLKGAGRALIDEGGRVRIISALACVDYVTLFAETTVENVLLAMQTALSLQGLGLHGRFHPGKGHCPRLWRRNGHCRRRQGPLHFAGH